MPPNRSKSLLDLEICRSPAFSLGTALMWLGHDCPGGCPPATDRERAAVWFVRLPGTAQPAWTKILVDVEFLDHPEPSADLADLLAQVNRCAGADHIRVRRRSAADRSDFIAALEARQILVDQSSGAR